MRFPNLILINIFGLEDLTMAQTQVEEHHSSWNVKPTGLTNIARGFLHIASRTGAATFKHLHLRYKQ